MRAQMQHCDWSAYAQLAPRIIEAVGAGRRGDQPFNFLALCDSAAVQRRCAETFARDKTAAIQRGPWETGPFRHERIRVAYVSADLRSHPVASLMAGVFERHDRRRFETLGVALRAPDGSELGERVRLAFDDFVDATGISDSEVAALMRSRQIDIAVDLTGYTSGMRPAIFAQRAAPAQVNFLGFPGTLGAAHMDYILADPFVIPRDSRQHYTEQVAYLPHCFQANDDRKTRSEVTADRAVAGLPADAVVLCCFNANYKLTPQVFDVWMRILRGSPAAVLWLVADNAAAEECLRRRAAAHGIASERLIFAPRLPYAQHLSRLRLADLFLDTLPFNAGATASDALWAGVPVLTCVGDAFAARMAGSLLTAVGLVELITYSPAEYERAALELVSTPTRLGELRGRLAGNRATHPLFDTARYTRDLEAAYINMWERAERGEPPASFEIRAERGGAS
jgi:predicted O-linked N-acetylglucosamine transferase (SPINDLY family)